uniref:Uncharacterized protein n=1 Tax=Tetradesmus obliquus TaxID=3088 RepID=A0A383VQA2_TETOB|eukprot:jgi/Sobl393_1/12089/SZX66576.1
MRHPHGQRLFWTHGLLETSTDQCGCLGRVVEGASAGAGLDNSNAMQGATHGSICKPPSCRDERYLQLESFIKGELERQQLRRSAAAAAEEAAAARAAAESSSSLAQQAREASALVMQLKVVSLDVFFVADSGQHDTNHGHLHCVIQSTDGRFSCVLRGIIPQSNIYDVYNMTKGLKAGLTLTAAAGPAGSRPVKVLSLPAEDLDGMVYSKRMDVHTRNPGSFSPTKLLPAKYRVPCRPSS